MVCAASLVLWAAGLVLLGATLVVLPGLELLVAGLVSAAGLVPRAGELMISSADMKALGAEVML